jgi:hypothetical protein
LEANNVAKDITIQEGGVAKAMSNVSKIRTDLQGGGTCYWVPESEVNTKTKHISENGTYAAASDNAYGFSSVTVSVRGGNGSAGSDGRPSTNPSAPRPGGSGSAITGIDADGDAVVVGVDEDGNVVTTKLPAKITIAKPPDRTEYAPGDTIDYTGIVVKLTDKDGNVYTDDAHPDGSIPMNELEFPMEKAEEAAHGGFIADARWCIEDAGTYLGRASDRVYTKTYGGKAIAFFRAEYPDTQSGWRGPVLVSTNSDAACFTSDGIIHHPEDHEVDGVTWYLNTWYHVPYGSGYDTPLPTLRYVPELRDILSMANAYAIPEGEGVVPVKWERVDGSVLMAAFEIDVSD